MAVAYSIICGYDSAGLRKETRRQANTLSRRSVFAGHRHRAVWLTIQLKTADRAVASYFQVRVSFNASFFLRTSSMLIPSRFAIAHR
jgi:hypothetical protein